MKCKVARLLCAVSVLSYGGSAFADDLPTPESIELRISNIGDLEMSCGELSQEAMLMQDIVATTQDIKDASSMQKHGITAAGAVGSFLVGTVTGGIGLAAAGFLLDHNVEEKSNDADSVQDIAEQRRTLMLGIHTAKGCYGPLENAMIDPAPATFMELAAIETASGEGHKRRTKPRYNE